MKHFITDQTAVGQRLDQFLAQSLQPELSRSRLQALIKDGQVTIDGVHTYEPKTKLYLNQEISLILPAVVDAKPQGEDIPLDILFEDDDLIVVNKPAGLVVHPGNGNWQATLVNALIYHCGDTLSGIGGVKRPGIVHRLDKNTSGVMVVAKNDKTHTHLSAQFADHGRTGHLQRSYYALVWGKPKRNTGTVDVPLGRSTRDRTRQAVANAQSSRARHAVTHFRVVETFAAQDDATAAASLLECCLETGRTHQIRVHMSHIGHPLVGDKEYGSAFKTKANILSLSLKQTVEGFSRQALHAASLTFVHPTHGDIVCFSSDLPGDMDRLLSAFRVWG